MAKSSLDMAAEQVKIEVEWKAFEQRPGGGTPEPEYARLIEERWPRTVEMGRRFGVEMRTHRFGVDTRLAHRAYKIVQRLAPARADAYNKGLYEAHFVEDRDLSAPEVLGQI